MAFVNKQTVLRKQSGYFYEGREISLSGQAGYPTKLPRHKGNWWPQDKKIEAATVFAVTRNFERTSDLVKMPVATLKRMATEAWWFETIEKVKKGRNDALDAKITETLDHTLDLIQDRVLNGESHYNSKKEEIYKLPLKAKDAAIVTSILFDKRQLIRGEATTRTEAVTSEQKLLALKDNFEKLARSKQINPNSEVIDAKFEELPEELQAGEIDGNPPTEGTEGGEEPSQSYFDERRLSEEGGQ